MVLREDRVCKEPNPQMGLSGDEAPEEQNQNGGEEGRDPC